MITTRQTRFAVLLIFALTLAPLGALAAPGQQQPEPEQQPLETRVFEVQHAGELDLRPILNMFGVRWSFDSRLKTLIVRAPGEIMPAIEQVVRRFDVAAPATPSVELTTFILVATNDGPQQALPPQLDPVVEQLRGVLPYRVFNALDSAIARGVDREVISVQGVMPQVPGAAPGNPDYSLRAGLIVTAESVTGEWSDSTTSSSTPRSGSRTRSTTYRSAPLSISTKGNTLWSGKPASATAP